jgi:hypothetical protein
MKTEWKKEISLPLLSTTVQFPFEQAWHRLALHVNVQSLLPQFCTQRLTSFVHSMRHPPSWQCCLHIVPLQVMFWQSLLQICVHSDEVHIMAVQAVSQVWVDLPGVWEDKEHDVAFERHVWIHWAPPVQDALQFPSHTCFSSFVAFPCIAQTLLFFLHVCEQNSELQSIFLHLPASHCCTQELDEHFIRLQFLLSCVQNFAAHRSSVQGTSLHNCLQTPPALQLQDPPLHCWAQVVFELQVRSMQLGTRGLHFWSHPGMAKLLVLDVQTHFPTAHCWEHHSFELHCSIGQ